MKLIRVDEFRQALREKREPGADGVFRVSTVKPRAFSDGSRRVRFCFSDGSVDRMGDTIDPDGWEMADFMANPVALWAHDSTAPPIGRAANVAVEGDKLMGDIEFADAETYPFADTIYRLVVGRYVNAVSVGFLPLEYSFIENDPERGFGIDFRRQELLEISVCPVPANANALAEARAKGINLTPLVAWAERTLDAGGMSVLPRAELEKLRKDAREFATMTIRRGTKPRRRADDDDDKPDDDKPDDKIQATCGRSLDKECGMKNPKECAVHGSAKAEGDDDDKPDDDKADDDDDKPDDDKPDDEEKRFRRALLRFLAPVRREDAGDDDLPLEHHDAIRIAHKSMRTTKSFMTEAMRHYVKGMGLLDGVVAALNEDGPEDKPDDDDDDKPDDDKPDDDKAAQLRRALQLRARIRSVT